MQCRKRVKISCVSRNLWYRKDRLLKESRRHFPPHSRRPPMESEGARSERPSGGRSPRSGRTDRRRVNQPSAACVAVLAHSVERLLWPPHTLPPLSFSLSITNAADRRRWLTCQQQLTPTDKSISFPAFTSARLIFQKDILSQHQHLPRRRRAYSPLFSLISASNFSQTLLLQKYASFLRLNKCKIQGKKWLLASNEIIIMDQVNLKICTHRHTLPQSQFIPSLQLYLERLDLRSQSLFKMVNPKAY